VKIGVVPDNVIKPRRVAEVFPTLVAWKASTNEWYMRPRVTLQGRGSGEASFAYQAFDHGALCLCLSAGECWDFVFFEML
jgi:hypothetical protein